MTTRVALADLPSLEGQQIGTSDWVEVTQDMIESFAQTTRDRQWIHLDDERARQGPYGSTIAHGFLTLSLLSWMISQTVSPEPAGLEVNYGLNRVRFPSPVLSGSRIRAHVSIARVEQLGGGVVQVERHVMVEREGQAKPACVAETLARYYPAQP